MKKSVLLSIIGVLLVVGVGITFAYFTSGVEVSGDGSTVELDPGDMIKVTYDAGDNSLSSNNLVPGQTLTKTFTVTVTPTSKENTASYSIYLDLTDNTFVKCDDSNYNSITNACIKDYEELTYEFKENTGATLSSGNLIGESGRILLAAQTKTVDKATTYEYTMEITFHETNADQNHNMDKVLNGSIEVEFGMSAREYILSHYDTVLTRDDFSTTVTNTTTGTIYKSANESQYDDDGEVYYFAGNPTDNWFQFGTNSSGQPLYWRIVRINGDGSIRLIYNGTSTATTGDSTMINTSQAFNTSSINNAYVGYMYKSGDVHGLTTNSSIKTKLDEWYLANLSDEAEYLDGNAGFCGDRYPSTSSSSSNGFGGTGTTTTYYSAYIRLITNKSPSFKCTVSQDLYTTNGSSKGNKALSNPIGLISADEVAFAGGVYGSSNSSYYLYNNAYYWTMSPDNFDSYIASVFYVYSGGHLGSNNVYWANYGVRPVINLKSAIAITGSGTTSDPFKVV
ncbi:MAG TPA: hypothetical protein IAB49_02615 [Candidatus Caccenecus avistercoris]|nr:hypothetical protein [Candidatus Caccenecus avistercoris]